MSREGSMGVLDPAELWRIFFFFFCELKVYIVTLLLVSFTEMGKIHVLLFQHGFIFKLRFPKPSK